MKKVLLAIASFFIGLVLFIWISKTIGWDEIKKALIILMGWRGLAIFTLSALVEVFGGLRWQIILRGLNIRASFREIFRFYLAGSSFAYFFPMSIIGDEVFMTYMLKERKAVPWSKGLASTILDRILELTANLLVIFFGMLYFFIAIGFSHSKLNLIYVAAFVITVLAVVFIYFKSFKSESIIKYFIQNERELLLEVEKEAFAFLKPRNILMWKGFGLSMARAGVIIIRAWLLIIFLGKAISVLPALSVQGFSYLALLLPIPASLGSHEAVQAFVFNALGLGAGNGLAYVEVIRGTEIVLYLVGLVIFIRLGLNLVKNNLLKKTEEFIGKAKILLELRIHLWTLPGYSHKID